MDIECDTFQVPTNGYVIRISQWSWLWMLLFGPVFLALKGVWRHVFVSLVLAPMTGGLSWLIYPFFVKGILRKEYLRRGWIPVTPF